MKNYLTYSAILFLLVSCSTQSDFENYVSQIKEVPTPAKFWTIGYTDKKIENNPDKHLFEKYKYKYADEIYGKLFENEKTIGIIYTVYGDALVPVLLTYNKEGSRVDSLDLFENASGFNLGKETYVSVTFFRDRTIKEVDSTLTWKLNTNEDDRIAGSEKLTIDSAMYMINDEGKIIKATPY